MAKKAIQLWLDSYIAFGAKLYSFTWIPIQLCEVTSISLLLRIGIKVADEWQISLNYVRGSNIYVPGYLDLRAWSLRLRTQIGEYHYVKALFPSQERCFFLRWIRGIFVIRRRAYVSLRKGYIGELGVRYLSTLNRGQDSRKQSHQMWGELTLISCVYTYIQVVYVGANPYSQVFTRLLVAYNFAC